MKNQNINWSKAVQQEKERKEQEARDKVEYDLRLDQAKDELWDKLARKDFNYSDFMDTCEDFDIEDDDLINSLI